MTYREALTDAAEGLKDSGVLFCDTPLLDASVLLAEAAGISREKLFASYPDELPKAVYSDFRKLLEKRLSGMPVSYIRHRKEFYSRDFYVDRSVLVPRPDTEVLVEKALEIIEAKTTGSGSEAPRLLDLCTGSGCIAVSLKLEAPACVVTASDVSPAALETAARNAENLGAEINFIESSLFNNIEGRFDIIATNPPYLTTEETAAMTEAGWPEPMLALEGGTDGLDLIRIIIKTSLDYLNDNSYLLIEAAPGQAEPISELLREAGFSDIGITCDMAGRNRVTSGRKSGTHDKEI